MVYVVILDICIENSGLSIKTFISNKNNTIKLSHG